MKWSRAKRKQLENGLQRGMTMGALADELNVSRPTVMEEIKRGLQEYDIKAKNYRNYKADTALLHYVIEKTGETNVGLAIAELLQAYERERSYNDAQNNS